MLNRSVQREGELLARVRRTVGANTGIVVVLVIVAVAFITGGLLDQEIFRIRNVITILHRMTSLGLVAIGQTFCILAGSFDLSVGSVISLSSQLFAGTVMGRPHMIIPAFGLIIAAGTFIGAVNGFFIARARINPFVTTMAMMVMAKGAALLYYPGSYGQITAQVKYIGYGRVGPLPFPFVILIGVFAVCLVVLNRTRFGLHVYALGGGAGPARLSGVNTTAIRILTHVICSTMAALAGVYFAARMGTGDPYSGQGYELESIAAVCIAGTSLFGGRGSLWGTLCGVLLLSMISNIFNHLNLPTMSQLILRGGIIIIAVAVYTVRSRTFGK
ncbi:MAG: ABC transporter permease [Spirochaetota bacterium]